MLRGRPLDFSTWNWRSSFDERFNSLMGTSPRAVAIFALTSAITAAVIGFNVGWDSAALWAVAQTAVKIWSLQATRGRRTWTGAAALNCIASILATSLVWTASAALYWMEGKLGLQVLAMVVLAGLLNLAQSVSFKSRMAAVVSGVIPSLAFVLLPLLFGGFDVVATISTAVGLALVLWHLVSDLQRNAANAKALLDAQARAEAANQAKSAFLAMMSHELRTPMNGVLGMAHALTLTRLDGRQAGYVDMLVRSGGGLMTILNDLLDISKIEAGKMELEVIDFDLHELCRRVHDLWSEAASAKGVSLAFDLGADVPQWVSGDPTRLRQVLQNLVSNALKFTSQGEVRLSLTALPAMSSGNVVIAVSDTGPGLSEAQQAKLFSAFVQADASTSREFGGTGLGLAICRQLTTLMGGEIELQSRLGEGSTFRVKLHLPLAEPVAADAPAAEMAGLIGRRILVVDDNAINLTVARAILEAAEATVATAADGVQALELMNTEGFDVVLMDVHMPRMGGIEALKRVRAGEAGPRDIPIVAMTADAMAGVDAELMAHGFDDVAAKPVNPVELILTISELAQRDLAAVRAA